MSNVSLILHKRSSVHGTKPSLSSLSAGELAINIADSKIFLKTIDDVIHTFSDEESAAFILNTSLSGVVPHDGNNNISQSFANILGGFGNNNSGAGSTIVNGETNNLSGDLSFIGSGLNNTISTSGDFSAIIGGQNNFVLHQNSFIIGSNLTSHSDNFTYVNNLSVQGMLHGDGSNLTGITGSGNGTDTGVRALTSNWENTYTTFKDVSSTFLTSETDSQTLSFDENTKDISISNGNTISLSALVDLNATDTEVRALTSNWQDTYTTFKDVSSTFLTSETDSQTLSFDENTKDLSISNGNTISLSALVDDNGTDTEVRALTSNWENTYTSYSANSASFVTTAFTDSKYLPLTGGTLTGVLSSTNSVYIDGSVEIGTGANTTLFVGQQSVGINTETPNEALTVVGNISATGTIHTFGGNSTMWNDLYTSYSAASSTFLTSETDSQTLSFDENTKDISISNGNTISLSALIDANGTDTGVRALTSNWESTYTTVNSNSADWSSAYSTVQANSATTWNYQGTDLKALSGNWQTNYLASSAYVVSDPIGITGASALTNLLQITQAGYNAITTPSSDTLYVIVG